MTIPGWQVLDLRMQLERGIEDTEFFLTDMVRVYKLYALRHAWTAEVKSFMPGSSGGLKEARLMIVGINSWERLQFERGTHRLQRRSVEDGRIHTTTINVFVHQQGAPEVDAAGSSVKIRTYNYPRNLAIDHRLGKCIPLLDFLEGEIEPLIDGLT